MTSPGTTAAIRNMPQRARCFALNLGLIGATVAALLLAPTSRSFGDDTPAQATPPGMTVTVAKSKRTCFSDTVLVMGTVVPRNEILVRPDREGMKISEILVKAGDTVSANQVLARLAPPNDTGSPVEVSASAAGLILAAPTVVGEMASARGEALFHIVAEGDLEVSADVPAREVSRLATGQAANVKIAGMDEAPGRVRFVSTRVDPTTQLGQAKISLGHNALLRVGASARATIDLGESCGVAIPLSALLFGPDGSVVQVVRDNRIETRRVKMGLFAQANVQINQGLAEGDLIVTRAGAFLRDGDRVRPVIASE
jgi:HlyD family secretion protein